MPKRQLSDQQLERSFGDFPRKWAAIAMVASLPFLVIPYSLGRPDKGLAAYFSVAILIVLVRISRDLLAHWWIIVVLLAYVVVHACAVASIGFQRLHFPAVVLVPVGIADFALWFSALWFAERRFGVTRP